VDSSKLGDHPLANVWDRGLAIALRRGLNNTGVDWTSIDAVRIAEVGEFSSPAIVCRAQGAQLQCRTFTYTYGIHDYHVETRVSSVPRPSH